MRLLNRLGCTALLVAEPGVEEATVIIGPTGVGMPVDAMVEAGTLNLVPVSVHRRPSHEP